jgi:TPR repeat protein
VRLKLTLILLCLLLYACGEALDLQAALDRGDYAAAVAQTRARAAAGDVAAQTALGTFYYLGVGVPRDFAQSVHWYERAALAGDPHAQRNLGSMFRQGTGMPKDDFRAFGWYDAARKGGHPRAQDYMQWMSLVVGWNRQALGRRLVAKDLEKQVVTHGQDKRQRP